MSCESMSFVLNVSQDDYKCIRNLSFLRILTVLSKNFKFLIDSFLKDLWIQTHMWHISVAGLTDIWQIFATVRFMTYIWHISDSFLTVFCNWQLSDRFQTDFWHIYGICGTYIVSEYQVSVLLFNRFGLALPGRFTKPRTRSRAPLLINRG